MENTKLAINELLQSVGVSINGNNSYDLKISNDQFYTRILQAGALGFGEAYMEGWWDGQQIDMIIDLPPPANEIR